MSDDVREQKIKFIAPVHSRKGAFPPIYPNEDTTLIQERKLFKLGPKKYELMSVVKHPKTQKPVLVPLHTYRKYRWFEGQWVIYRPLGSFLYGDDHNPDYHHKEDE